MNDAEFTFALSKAIATLQKGEGIGRQKERTLHAALKYYFQPDDTYHEIKIDRYIADIFAEGEVIEIQTRQFNTMRGKLDCFLKQHPVTVVYPVAATKWLVWVDENTGEITKKRRSPKSGNPLEVLFELYKISDFIKRDNFSLCVAMLEVTEYKSLSGWSRDRKKGAYRLERIPENLVDVLHFGTAADYLSMIPDSLPESFTVQDFASAAKMSKNAAGTALLVLYRLGTVERTGKSGNAFIYKRNTALLKGENLF